jgi:hypothetical protein
VILPLPPKPRDLGLLINVLIYRVPIGAELTEAWIEVARKHCRMKPERLAELRAEPHARYWPRILERRAGRLAYFKLHGELPGRWLPLLPGEPNRVAQLLAFHKYRKGGLAKLKARLRKHPESAEAKLNNRYQATKRIRSRKRKGAALQDVEARLVANLGAKAGKLKLAEYEALKSVMLPDDALPRRFRRKVKDTGLPGEPAEQKGREEASAKGSDASS